MLKRNLLAALFVASLPMAAHAADSYTMDPPHTYANFTISHLGFSTMHGRFDKSSGKVTLDRAAKHGTVDIAIESASVSTGFGKRDDHLKSPDFFNAAEFPTARFEGNRFVFDGDKLAEVGGQLTMLGKTHPLTLKATQFNCYQNQMLKREVCGGDFEATLVRSRYGIDWGLNFGFADTVRLVVQIEAIRQP